MSTTEADALLARTARGAGWVIGWRMLTRALGLISTLVLVRVLLPSDFGLVTLAMGFSQAIDSLSSLGVEEAVIREKNPTVDLYNAAFTINFIRGLATAALLVAAAWPIARFFGDVRLVPVMLAIAVIAIVGACENIGIVEFRRSMAFDKEFILMSGPRVVSIVVAISAAVIFRSYWALIAGILTGTACRVAMGYAIHPFRPRLGLRAWRRIAGFSFWSWLMSLTSLVRDRSNAFVIGRVLNLTQVGMFSVGSEIAELPTTELVSPLGRACFSGFATVRHSGTEKEAGEAFMRVLSSIVLLALPAGFGISLVAEPIVRLALGTDWLAATPVIQVLGAAGSVAIVGTISGALLNAYGMLRETFVIQLGGIAVRIPAMIVLVLHFGLGGAAIGAAMGMAVEHLLYLALALRRLRIGPVGFLLAVWRYILATMAMAAVLALSGLGWSPVVAVGAGGALSTLVLGISVGALVYCAVVTGLWLASGRRAGAEQDMFGMLTRSCGSIVRVLRRQWTAVQGSI